VPGLLTDPWARPTLRESCQPVSGYAAGDLRSTGLTSVKDLRMRPDAPVTIRVKSQVKVTGGRNLPGAVATMPGERHGGTPKNPGGPNARKRAARRAA
jgi:hypothetical protein